MHSSSNKDKIHGDAREKKVQSVRHRKGRIGRHLSAVALFRRRDPDARRLEAEQCEFPTGIKVIRMHSGLLAGSESMGAKSGS